MLFDLLECRTRCHYEGQSGSLVAQGGAGESLLMFDICVSLALGKPVLGAPARDPIPVIYLDMENPKEELAQRLRSMGLNLSDVSGTPLLHLSFPELTPLDTPEGCRMLNLG
jgi:RecA-family ATPase